MQSKNLQITYVILFLTHFIEGILHEMEAQQHGPRDNPKYQRQSNQPVVDEAESAYSSALSLAQTFEGAKNVLISMNVETVDGKMAPSLPWLRSPPQFRCCRLRCRFTERMLSRALAKVPALPPWAHLCQAMGLPRQGRSSAWLRAEPHRKLCVFACVCTRVRC